MARPRSPDKQEAILAAAARALAEDGASATTARIARLAGVAEGTVFTYFDSKDALLNALYLDLKAGMRDAMMTGFPESVINCFGIAYTVSLIPEGFTEPMGKPISDRSVR